MNPKHIYHVLMVTLVLAVSQTVGLAFVDKVSWWWSLALLVTLIITAHQYGKGFVVAKDNNV